MNEVRQRFDASSLAGGLILIGLGTLFLLSSLHIADFGDLIGTYWPLIVVAFGASKLWQRDTFWSGLWLVAVGSWLQAVNVHAYGLTFRNSWPLLLIALGAGMVVRTFLSDGPRAETNEEKGEEGHGA